ncbi:MAG: 1-acyl-sn-glycerol-3-phosphate acyltransferase [Bacteroidales bacterium]|nr:1-acyl-sn-glycerol-3-phosphate acyltransferase [Bacteroidales bacterium]MBN2820841.1 1-acyl-sn-glycerol-3-phosphate acyltransferase [Bacteroidales bacterium]
MKIAPNYIYTILAYMFLHILTAISVILSLVFYTLRWKKAMNTVIYFWARGSFLIIGKRLHAEGLANLEKGKKYILMANHTSMFDIMGIMSVFPGVAWFGREYLIKIPVFGTLLRGINYVPMKTTNLRNTKEMVNELIKNTNNQTVAIFPEGTRTVTGELSKFRKGFLHVLKASELDILPVTLIGFFDFKPKNRFYFRYRPRLTVQIHPPLFYSELKELADNEIINLVQSRIESVLPTFKTA